MFSFIIFDPLYFIILAPAILLSLYATYKVRATFTKYSKYVPRSGFTGEEAARRMLLRAGVNDCKIIQGKGFLSDHYNPLTKTLSLSTENFRGRSISAIGIACHEAGHAIQHNRGYALLKIRSMMVPAVNFSSSLSWILILLGIFLAPKLLLLGVALFSLSVIFSIITLPVEWDASARAKTAIIEANFLNPDEAVGASKVLNAAFLTYLAAAVSAILTLVYYLLRSGFLGGDE